MSKTPLTDSVIYSPFMDGGECVPKEFAVQLEKKMNELSRTLRVIVDHGGIGPEDMFHDARDALNIEIKL